MKFDDGEKMIALVAHDAKKDDLVEFARRHKDVLSGHRLIATGTTGSVLRQELKLPVSRVQSGPLGGDLQLGAMIVTKKIKGVIFLRDPLTAHPHDPDIAALLKVCDIHNVPLATNVTSADMMLYYLKRKNNLSTNKAKPSRKVTSSKASA